MSNEELLLNKVLDASSNTIWEELQKIKESSETEKKIIRRRWAWELIQNASDCTPKGDKIDINIEYDENNITFGHNGLPFSYENLLDLITQISSKQSSEEKKTGKFGTGFMSTHLLSEVVQIKGSYIQNDNQYTPLEFTVDRSGNEYSEIKDKTKTMLEQLKFLNGKQKESSGVYEDTKFIYSLENEEIRTAVAEGIGDLKKNIPYVLTFNEHINSITFNGSCYKKVNERTSNINDKLKIVQIDAPDGNNELLILNEKNVTVSCPVKFDEKCLVFLPIHNKIPKVFCEFPLLGTEDFSYPIIINSNLFEVERDRNAIRDSNKLNNDLIQVAVSLYKELIDYCTTSEITKNEFNICSLESPDTSAIQNYSYREIRNYIDTSSIVPTHYGCATKSKRSAFKNRSGEVVMSIPTTEKVENLDLFWDILSEFENLPIPTKETYRGWGVVFGSNIQFSHINNIYLKDSCLDELTDKIQNKMPIFEWLNAFYNLWLKDEGLEKVIESAHVLNQNNKFVKFEKVNFDSGINDELKQILSILGGNIKGRLIRSEILSFKDYFEEYPKKIKTNEDCSVQIESKVSEILGKENVETEREESIQRIFNRLTNWFISNPEKSKEWFENLYPKRMMLSSPEENLRRYKIAEKIEEKNIKYEELDEIINNREKVMEIITNSELSKEEIIQQLKHVVTSSEEMKRYVESLLFRSTKNVYEYLKGLRDYTLPATLEDWINKKYSETVFSAKYKGEDYRIIIRPSDYQKIIFYYDEELEALDDVDYQLWTDDGEVQRMVTLGDLLKTTGISKIPLTKL
ncbi:sacsin N-terminal ATP-binding-like domain-containing protein [Planococcus alpniumensis]|uniref:sacsin N-terminal ATP-binding-like domain-containing protein n=1 Tax=Planococcus alpniumensis TaxID=2708345 RepID=UPI001B8D8AB9|nr:hypothetical protein [Planococcus sp. MSAK28401]